MISKILIPTDGSEVAHKAARYRVDLVKQLKASVIDEVKTELASGTNATFSRFS